MKSGRHVYSEEQNEFIKKHCKLSRLELARLFNERFGTNISEKAMKSKCSRDGLKGQDTSKNLTDKYRFKPGHNFGYRFTSQDKFSKKYEVGDERLRKGYVEVKIRDDADGWIQKHRLIWQQSYGPIPKGHDVKFKDGDSSNLDIDNLYLASKGEACYMAATGLHKLPPEMIDTALLIAKVALKRSERERNNDK